MVTSLKVLAAAGSTQSPQGLRSISWHAWNPFVAHQYFVLHCQIKSFQQDSSLFPLGDKMMVQVLYGSQ